MITKGKWEIFGESLKAPQIGVIERYNNRLIADCLNMEDAKLIVKAVNSHAKLLEACKFAMEFIEMWRNQSGKEFGKGAYNKLKQAIKEAGE